MSERFVADAMLGSLARKLRILGFDTAYFELGEDSELELMAKKEGRTILTADKALFAHARRRGIPATLVEGRTDTARLRAVWKELGLSPRSLRMISRCALCNGSLERVARKAATALGAPEKAVSRHRLFYRCVACSKIYWRGSHWTRLRRLPR